MANMKNRVSQKGPPKMTEIAVKSGKELFIATLFVIEISKVTYQNEGMILSILDLEK